MKEYFLEKLQQKVNCRKTLNLLVNQGKNNFNNRKTTESEINLEFPKISIYNINSVNIKNFNNFKL